MAAAKHHISCLAVTVRPLDTASQIAKKAISEHSLKMVDMEDCMHRNNRLMGFSGGVEGLHPKDFLEGGLKASMEATTFTCLFAIEWAQCIPARAPPSGAIPRPMIAKILHFHNREIILRSVRNGPELEFNGYSISIYPDFSVATQKQQATFQQVKKHLRDLHIAYSMPYPAKLYVVDRGKAHFFTTPTEASKWLDSPHNPRGCSFPRPP